MMTTRLLMTLVSVWLLQTACSSGDETAMPLEEAHHVEGHTEIQPEMADAFGVEVAAAGAAEILETIEVFGTVTLDPAREAAVQARFPGVIRSVSAQVGDRVEAGAALAEVESDESLSRYSVTAPTAGVVVQRNANAGEQTSGRTLFRIIDTGTVWGMFRIFPRDRSRVGPGESVAISTAAGERLAEGVIDWIDVSVRRDQSVSARVILENPERRLLPGMFLSGRIIVARHAVNLAVKRSALQTYQGETVVYRQTGDLYEARPVVLGRQDGTWAEVLDGLSVSDQYVTTNSYLIKADIDKDSASHEH